MRKLWFDLTNTPHVHFLKPLISRYKDNFEIIISARDYAETVKFLQKELLTQPIMIGKHAGKHRLKKLCNILYRLYKTNMIIPDFDIALSCGGVEASFVAKSRRKSTIAFDDNDVSPNWMYSRFTDYVFFPSAVSKDTLLSQGFKLQSIFQYEGYKEDVYIADYVPDYGFVENLPFDEFVLVRPENMMASYVRGESHSVVPDLLSILVDRGYRVLYLPRTCLERRYAYGLNNIYIPREPIQGLDAVFFSRAVLSGAGSFSREAACLGKPAVSFYAGQELLAVDRQMIRDRWLFHSRNPEEIVEYVQHVKARDFDRDRSKSVQNAIFTRLDEILLN